MATVFTEIADELVELQKLDGPVLARLLKSNPADPCVPAIQEEHDRYYDRLNELDKAAANAEVSQSELGRYAIWLEAKAAILRDVATNENFDWPEVRLVHEGLRTLARAVTSQEGRDPLDYELCLDDLGLSEELLVQAPVAESDSTQKQGDSVEMYRKLKRENPDTILLVQMGHFYEAFFEDAVMLSEALGLVLTRRGKHAGSDIPMCGIPVQSLTRYGDRMSDLNVKLCFLEGGSWDRPSVVSIADVVAAA